TLNCAGCELIFEDKWYKVRQAGLKKLLRTLLAVDTLVVWKPGSSGAEQ
ncbi:TPA: hypothetical protein HLU96_22360, partial [Escherichia coli]|nr:hypothetical protein [Escherichia coli]HAJ4500499.1 hypothetical protein [Escherichia coli]HAJ4514620.1 hypothetical protein [Escherichia coli]HAJ5721318.1 hypothetical protein [Escherichia coli]